VVDVQGLNDMSAIPDNAAPLSASAFAARLVRLDPGPRIAVAFSGGADSLGLLVLAAQWAARSRHRSVVALTVDHGLRAEAAAEARLCARMAKALGVPHRILHWRGDKPRSGIQAAAREARYALLMEACRAADIGSLLVAHHLEDQAETFLLRLARGSGVDGLAGMAAERLLDGMPPVRLLRPLLDVPREALRAVAARSGLTPIEDPSNDNPRFDRVRMRRLASDFAALGLTPQRLADTAGHMARARQALDGATRDLFATSVWMQPTGHIEAETSPLLAAPSEIGFRALSEMLKAIGVRNYPPRFEALCALYEALRDDALARGRTLNGCKLVTRDGRLHVLREAAAAAKAPPLCLRPGEAGVWDGRFELKLATAPKASADQLKVQALGGEGLRVLRHLGLVAPQAPKASFSALPGLWREGWLVAAPHFGTVDPAYGVDVGLRVPDFFQVP
jgi:tRNA(Ile)-lysidine synthase